MLRIYLVQNWYDLPDVAAMTEVIDSRAFSDFCSADSRYKTNRRPSQSKHCAVRLQAQLKRREHEKSSVRAKVEHVFGIVKGLFGYRKTRYRGLRKQSAKQNMMFALANLYLADKRGLLARFGVPVRRK